MSKWDMLLEEPIGCFVLPAVMIPLSIAFLVVKSLWYDHLPPFHQGCVVTAIICIMFGGIAFLFYKEGERW